MKKIRAVAWFACGLSLASLWNVNTCTAQGTDVLAVTAFPAGSELTIERTIEIPRKKNQVYFSKGEPSFSPTLVVTYCALSLRPGVTTLKAGTKCKVKEARSPEVEAFASWTFEDSSPVQYMSCSRNMSGTFLQAKFKVGNLRNQFGDFVSFNPPGAD